MEYVIDCILERVGGKEGSTYYVVYLLDQLAALYVQKEVHLAVVSS